MKFKQFLTEIFDSPVGYLVEYQSAVDGGLYKFYVDQQMYACSIVADPRGNGYNVTFAAYRPVSPGSTSMHRTYNAWDAKGKELTVYSTVIAIVIQYFKKYPLKPGGYFRFAGFQGEKQHKVYDRIAKIFGERLGYTVQSNVSSFLDKEYHLINK